VDGYRALKKLDQMRDCARALGIDTASIEFAHATLAIVAKSREYLFGTWDPKLPDEINAMVRAYEAAYPQGFHFICNFEPIRMKKWLFKFIFYACLRRHPHYRFFDRVFLNRFTQAVYPVVRIWQNKHLPEFTSKQAMGLQVLFK
jgi:hypothetical protein